MEKIGGSMDAPTQYIEPFVGNYNAFLSLLRNHQMSLPGGPSLTNDQIVYVAGVLSAFVRHEYSVGGMRISDPTDLAMPEVLEHIYGNRKEAELAGGYLLASMGTITLQDGAVGYDRNRVNFYDIIARACFQVAVSASKNPGHKMMMRSIASEYRDIRKEITRFARQLNRARFAYRPS